MPQNISPEMQKALDALNGWLNVEGLPSLDNLIQNLRNRGIEFTQAQLEGYQSTIIRAANDYLQANKLGMEITVVVFCSLYQSALLRVLSQLHTPEELLEQVSIWLLGRITGTNVKPPSA